VSGDFVAREEEGDRSRARKLRLWPCGALRAEGVKGPARPLRVLRREPGGLVVALWGDRIVHGFVSAHGGTLTVTAEGRPERLRLLPAAVDAMERSVAAAAGASGVLVVKSPIPGLVKSVSLKDGDAVAEGQTVVVLEAMKMENEIPAPQAGTVKGIKVEAGQTVDAGVTLFEIAT